MTRKDFIGKVASDAGVSARVAADVLSAVETETLDVIANEDSIRFRFGTFSGVTRAAHKARNPKTGEAVQVAEKHGCPKFKASKTAKE